MTPARRVYAAWAIRHDLFANEHGISRDRRSGFIGIYPEGPPSPITARLFATRREAREFLRPKQAPERTRSDGFRYWLLCRVVRVTIEVCEVKP